MPGIITPRRFNQQPQHAPQIDWSNPITRGLCFAVVGNDPRDLVSGKGPSTWNKQTADASIGRTLVGVGSGQTAEYPFNPVVGSNGNGTGDVTLMSFANPFSESREGQLIGVTMSGSPFKQIGIFANFDGGSGSASAGMMTIETYNGGNPSYGAATGYIDGKFHAYLGKFANGNCRMFVDGVDRTSNSLANNGNFGLDASSRISIGSESYNSTTRAANAKIALSLAWNRLLTDAEVRSIVISPWQIFVAPPRRIWSAASGGITGSLQSQEAGDALAASGTVTLAAITGTAAASEGIDTLAASGSTGFATITGTLARSEGIDTLVAAGAIGNAITGSLTVSEGIDIGLAAGTVTNAVITASLARSEGADTLSGSGVVTLPLITGSASSSEGVDTLAAYGGFASDAPAIYIATIMRKSTVNLTAPLVGDINLTANLL